MALLGVLVLATTVASQMPALSGDVPPSRCLESLVSIEAGVVPSSRQFAHAACGQGQPRPAFQHAPDGSCSRTTRAIAQSEIVSRFPEYGIDLVCPGEKLTVVIASGPVRIMREVTAKQAAWPGQRLFVETSDGQVLSARYEALDP